MFERLTSILAKIGIQLHPSVIYREFTSQAPAPEIGLPDCTWEFAAAAEMQELAQVPAYGISLDELYERLGERAECFVLRHRGSILAFPWCQDRKSVGKGKRVSVRVDLGGRRIIKKKKKT